MGCYAHLGDQARISSTTRRQVKRNEKSNHGMDDHSWRDRRDLDNRRSWGDFTPAKRSVTLS